jgi:hypothetical protein
LKVNSIGADLIGDAFLVAPSTGELKLNETSSLVINQYPLVPLKFKRPPTQPSVVFIAAAPSPKMASMKPWAESGIVSSTGENPENGYEIRLVYSCRLYTMLDSTGIPATSKVLTSSSSIISQYPSVDLMSVRLPNHTPSGYSP